MIKFYTHVERAWTESEIREVLSEDFTEDVVADIIDSLKAFALTEITIKTHVMKEVEE